MDPCRVPQPRGPAALAVKVAMNAGLQYVAEAELRPGDTAPHCANVDPWKHVIVSSPFSQIMSTSPQSQR